MRKRLPVELFLVTYNDTEVSVDTVNVERRLNLLPYLSSWKPAIPPLKEGGLYLAGAYLDGRQLALASYENALEALVLALSAKSGEGLVELTREIRWYLRRGRSYFTSQWQDKPVWIQARGPKESASRYALLINGNAPEDNNPYQGPLDDDVLPAALDWPLELERGHWLSNKPGEYTYTPCYGRISATVNQTFGNADITGTPIPDFEGLGKIGPDVHVSNKLTRRQLTHIFRFDSSTGLYSGNLVGAAPPYDLLPDPVGVGDCVYFIIQEGAGIPYTFDNLVFHLSRANGTTGLWEYYRTGGVGWTALPGAMDYTNNLTNSVGNTSICFPMPSPSLWDATVINGITGHMIRWRVTAVGTGVVPRQGYQNVYTCNWPHVYIDGAQIGGDLPALLRLRLVNRSELAGGGANSLHAHRILVGLRSTGRGAQFMSHIFLAADSDVVPVTKALGANASYVNDQDTAFGRRVTFNPAGVGTETVLTLNFLSNYIARQFKGKFRAFLRGCQVGGAAGDILLKLKLSNYNPYSNPDWESEFVPFQNLSPWQVLDFGEIQIGADQYDLEKAYATFFTIDAKVNSATPDIDLFDLILIPVDEWCGEFLSFNTDAYSSLGRDATFLQRFLEIDSVINMKRPIRAVIRRDVSPYDHWAKWESVAAGPAILQKGQDQRLFFLSMRYASPTDLTDQRAHPELLVSVEFARNQRYESFRGSG